TYPAPLVSNTCGSPVTVTCQPASGSTFPVGATPVTCTTTDVFGDSTSCSFMVTVLPVADLAVSIGAASGTNKSSPLIVTEGQPLTYSIAVTNSGPNPAGNVVVQDLLPDSFIFESATTSQGTVQAPYPYGTPLTASLGTLAPGGLAIVQITGFFSGLQTTIPN